MKKIVSHNFDKVLFKLEEKMSWNSITQCVHVTNRLIISLLTTYFFIELKSYLYETSDVFVNSVWNWKQVVKSC